MHRNVTLVAVVAAGLLLAVGTAQGGDQVRKAFTMPADFSGVVEATGCSNTPGPEVKVQGSLALAGFKVEVGFTTPSGGPSHTEKATVEQQVVPENQPVGIPQQSVVGPLGANPYIWLQLLDQRGRPLTSEIFLGQCSQGTFNVSASLLAPSEAIATVSTSACESASGAIVALDGQMDLQPVNGRLIFRDSNTTGGPKGPINQASIELAMVPAIQTYPFPQQEVSGGVGNNPLISLQMRQGDSEAIGNEIVLGRCQAIAN